MAALAFKAISYGAEQIPDKFFDKIPGGYFTPQEQRDIEKSRKDRKDRERRKSKERSGKRSSRRERSPTTDYSDYDTDYERERRKTERRRAKSAGRNSSRSPSRGRRNRHSSDFDSQAAHPRDMAQAEQGAPYFPPPPTSEFKPYNPQEYAASPAQDDYRPSSATPAYGYTPQPAAAYPVQPLPVQRDAPRSASSARYTPGPGYAPSPAVMPIAPVSPPPLGTASAYSPYNPADYPGSSAGYQPSPPPFTRQRSNSQPSFGPGAVAPYPTYIPPSQQQVAAYNGPPSRRDSTKPRREHRHRARSADSHAHSRSSKDHRRDDSRMAKVRDRFDGMDLREKGLAASVGGALAGGLAGRQLGKSRLTALAGAAAGALGARQLATRSRSRSDRPSSDRSRSRSRTRTHDDRERSKSRGLRARSRSVIDRFRSKSRGPDDRDVRKDRHDRRPDHGYDYGRDDYDYFSSDSDGDGSPVKTRRHRRRDY